MRMAIATLLVACLVSSAAWAQEDEEAENRSRSRIQKINEVERGFFIRSTFGFSMALGNMFNQDSSDSPLWPPGPLLGLELGHDLGQVASLHMAFYGQSVSGSHTPTGRADVSNDASTLLAMVGARFNIATTKRMGWYLKANVGYMLAVPAIDTMDDGLVVHATTGVEYATNLRHFAVGLEAGIGFSMATSALSIIVTPTLKYVF